MPCTSVASVATSTTRCGWCMGRRVRPSSHATSTTRPRAEQDQATGDPVETRPEGLFGFLTPQPLDDPDFTFDDRDDDYPETWLEFDANGSPRLKRYYRDARAQTHLVAPDGRVGSGTKVWFQPGKFRLCLRCRNTQGRRGA